jgi:transcriptional regulator of aromatic amino acid metabolism
LLLVGPREATAVALRELDACLIAPIHYWEENGPLILPLERSGTLVLQDIGRLTPAQQNELFDWLCRFEYPIQVVSVAIQMPFALVMRGQFREDLYYRLNTMLFEL